MKKLLLGLFILAHLTACDISQEAKTRPGAGGGNGADHGKGDDAGISNSAPQVCSFNIQFLGNSKLRKNKDLAQILKEGNCSMVVVQEIVAPPDLRLIPNNPFFGGDELPEVGDTGEFIRPQHVVTEFFLEMHAAGFDSHWLSEQDTGPAETNNNNGSATEWWAVFYKASVWEKDRSLPHGFLADDVTKHPTWDRVPYAFSFKEKQGHFDFVLISVHLRPGAGSADVERRAVEINGIKEWISEQKKNTSERDFVVLGDFNIENAKELQNLESEQFKSLNTNALVNTNTNLNNPKPYDHIFIAPADSSEVALENNFSIINLIQILPTYWGPETQFPGNPYNHNLFRLHYSDHHPISFTINIPDRDDD